MYNWLRNILFLFDPEKVHYFSMNALRFFCSIGWVKLILKKLFEANHPIVCMGLQFTNPVGLGAGFDKNAAYLTALEVLGFGFVEIGTVTPIAQDGNEKPRLFRLPKDKALVNRMGFNNHGADVIANRLAKWRKRNPTSQLIIGGNIGKNKNTPNEDAWKDYEICFDKLHPFVDYFVVNVSSPNTPGLRALQEKDNLKIIFSILHHQNKTKNKPKPILLKIAPDLNQAQVDDIISLCHEIQLDGLIVSNTTIDRGGLATHESFINRIGNGGLSGLPVKNKSTQMLQYIQSQQIGNTILIGSGGIFTGVDAQEKIEAGAALVQVWTGFVYEGPFIVKKIISHLNK